MKCFFKRKSNKHRRNNCQNLFALISSNLSLKRLGKSNYKASPYKKITCSKPLIDTSNRRDKTTHNPNHGLKNISLKNPINFSLLNHKFDKSCIGCVVGISSCKKQLNLKTIKREKHKSLKTQKKQQEPTVMNHAKQIRSYFLVGSQELVKLRWQSQFFNNLDLSLRL